MMSDDELNGYMDKLLKQLVMQDMFDAGISMEDFGRELGLFNFQKKYLVDKAVEFGLADEQPLSVLHPTTFALDVYRDGGWQKHLERIKYFESLREEDALARENREQERLRNENERAIEHLSLTKLSARSAIYSAVAAWGAVAATVLQLFLSIANSDNKQANALNNMVLTSRLDSLTQVIQSVQFKQSFHLQDRKQTIPTMDSISSRAKPIQSKNVDGK